MDVNSKRLYLTLNSISWSEMVRTLVGNTRPPKHSVVPSVSIPRPKQSKEVAQSSMLQLSKTRKAISADTPEPIGSVTPQPNKSHKVLGAPSPQSGKSSYAVIRDQSSGSSESDSVGREHKAQPNGTHKTKKTGSQQPSESQDLTSSSLQRSGSNHVIKDLRPQLKALHKIGQTSEPQLSNLTRGSALKRNENLKVTWASTPGPGDSNQFTKPSVPPRSSRSRRVFTANKPPSSESHKASKSRTHPSSEPHSSLSKKSKPDKKNRSRKKCDPKCIKVIQRFLKSCGTNSSSKNVNRKIKQLDRKIQRLEKMYGQAFQTLIFVEPPRRHVEVVTANTKKSVRSKRSSMEEDRTEVDINERRPSEEREEEKDSKVSLGMVSDSSSANAVDDETFSDDLSFHLLSEQNGKYYFLTATTVHARELENASGKNSSCNVADDVSKKCVNKNIIHFLNHHILPNCIATRHDNLSKYKWSPLSEVFTLLKKEVKENMACTEVTVANKGVNLEGPEQLNTFELSSSHPESKHDTGSEKDSIYQDLQRYGTKSREEPKAVCLQCIPSSSSSSASYVYDKLINIS